MEVGFDDEAHLDDVRVAFSVPSAGDRLDGLIVRHLGTSVRDVRRLAVEGRIRIDGRAYLGQFPPLRGGERVVVLGDRIDPSVLPERIRVPILLEDSEVLFVDKPAPLPMTPGTGHCAATLANALRGMGRSLSSVEGPLRPGIVHRLDKGTSGALIVAKNDSIHRELTAHFLTRTLRRSYLALVHGHPKADEFSIDAGIGRKRIGRKAQAVRPDGLTASTRFVVVGRLSRDVSLISAYPSTGRKHQIRVHLAACGHPIVGDTLYGGGDVDRTRLCRAFRVRRPLLHASALEIAGRAATAPPPADMTAIIDQLIRKRDGSTRYLRIML